MGASARRKGHSFERAVAEDFRSVGFPYARRLLEYQEGFGIDLSGTLPFLVQVKAMNRMPNMPGLIKEILVNKQKIVRELGPESEEGMPIAVVKLDRQGTFVTLRYEDFLSLVESVYGPDQG